MSITEEEADCSLEISTEPGYQESSSYYHVLRIQFLLSGNIYMVEYQ